MSIRHVANSIRSGEISMGMAVGVEVMSKHGKPASILADVVASDTQVQGGQAHPGWKSEMLAQTRGISRQKQDGYALIGHTKANEAQSRGIFEDEIIPIEIRGRVIDTDDTTRSDVTAEDLASLESAFPQWGDGLTTDGNASPPGDGAALCILTTRERAEAEGMEILGKYVTTTTTGSEPRLLGTASIHAIRKILAQLGLSKEDVDVYEINEAFASQLAYCVEKLDLSSSKVNPNGGAFALSDPTGMTGMRQVVTGLAELQRLHRSILCTSMCAGAGMGASGLFVNEVSVGVGDSG